MRSTILCTLCLCLSLFCTAQKQANIWVFGYNAGVDFNTSPPSKILTGAGMGGLNDMQEGTSCISDSAGRLLIWSDGLQAFGPYGLMLNGSGLAGDGSSTQGSIIVPKPGSDSLFYLFTSDAQEPYFYQTTPHGYNYSVINMCLGWKNKDTIWGGVMAGQKNIKLVDKGTEKLCAASDGANGYWILGHRGYSDSFYAWHLTSTGLSARVATRIGPRMGVASGGNVYGFGGQMKFNAAGTRVAAVTQTAPGTPSTLDLFDFDPLTGKLSNHCQNIISSTAQPYGVEFSPDGSKVYTSYNEASSITYLIKNTLNSNCGITGASRDTIFERTRSISGLLGIQAAPDGKLYVGYDDYLFNRTELHRINNPNGAVSYDTAAFTYFKQNRKFTVPPSFVAGFKYHNKLCKCSQPLAVSTPSAAGEIRIFPNPADEQVTIIATNGTTANLSVVITDATGRMIYRTTTLPVQVDLRKQAAGLYFYRVYGEQGIVKSGKFVVAH
jgi:hypothetical protein